MSESKPSNYLSALAALGQPDPFAPKSGLGSLFDALHGRQPMRFWANYRTRTTCPGWPRWHSRTRSRRSPVSPHSFDAVNPPAPANALMSAAANFLTGNSALPPLSAVETLFGPSPTYNALAQALRGADDYRSRSSWNDRFSHWGRPASTTEAGTIERAEDNVTRAITGSAWLSGERVTIRRQGSYHNKTNVRTEADIDLRAEHTALKVDYAPGVTPEHAKQFYGISGNGPTVGQIFGSMRSELLATLRAAFGYSNVDGSGTKAIRIKGITGSRAEVDVVPAIRYRDVHWSQASGFFTLDGVAIFGTDHSWTINYPEYHAQNGINKRARTQHRFKKVVRIFKPTDFPHGKSSVRLGRARLRVACPGSWGVARSRGMVLSDARWPMRVLLQIAALAVASPTFAATSEPPTPPVAITPSAAPVHGTKNAAPTKRFQIYDSLRQLAPDRFGQPQPMPKNGAGPGIG